MIRLAGSSNSSSSTFKWTTSEQVWPFGLADDDSTLYCKEVNIGIMPNTTVNQTALTSIYSGLTPGKIHSITGYAGPSNGLKIIPIPFSYGTAVYSVSVQAYNGNLEVECFNNTWSNLSYIGHIRLVYKH